jgi:hypothetical protein
MERRSKKLYALCYQEGHPEKIVAVHDLSYLTNMDVLLFYQTQIIKRRVVVPKYMTENEFKQLRQSLYPMQPHSQNHQT